MNKKKPSIVIPSAVNRPNQGSIYDDEPALCSWSGQFSSSRLGPMIIKGKIETQGRCPINTRLPYTTTVYITYQGIYKKGVKMAVEAIITPAGQMMVKVGEGSETREIVFVADTRSEIEASGGYTVISGPMQDRGTFRLSKGEADYRNNYL
jgi:hypothetical protein